MALYTIAEVIIISLLVMPMPSNALRGKIQGQSVAPAGLAPHQHNSTHAAHLHWLWLMHTGAVSRLWHSQEYVKKTSWVLLTLNS